MEYNSGYPDEGSGLQFFISNHSPPSLSSNFSDSPSNNEKDDEPSETTIIIGVKATITLFIILSAIFGNILVIISVFKFRNLRIIANSFIVSLAVADLLVALLAMPFNASQVIAGRWVFSILACDIFNANDVLFSTASLLNLCCISMDRYIAITDPFHYQERLTKRKVALMLTCAWGFSALISHIPIHTGWYAAEVIKNTSCVQDGICVFEVNPYYSIISSTISFWIPTFIMVVMYIKIFLEARKQEKKLMSLIPAEFQSLNGRASFSGNRGSPSYQRTDSEKRLSLSPAHKRESINDFRGPGGSDSQDQASSSNRGIPSANGNGYQSDEPRRLSKERNRMKREHKAAKTLGIIMGCFLLCWLPFFLWYVITRICGDEHCPTPPVVTGMLFWIGYFNSALNPVIYAFFNRDFRNAFKALLNCRELQRFCQSKGYCCPSRESESFALRSDPYYSEMSRQSARPSLATNGNNLQPSPGQTTSRTYASLN